MEKIQVFESALLGERYYRTVHPSGLPIFVFPKDMTVTHAVFATRYGSVHNRPDEKGRRPFPDGIAHFLEHKLFSNADGTDSFERFSALGVDANAYTSHTRTVYLFSATDHVDEALAELIDFVTHPYFTPQTVKKEQGIIAEEIRMCMDNPYNCCYYNMLDGLYFTHPVKDEICGTLRSIARITDRALYDCYATHYALSNMALVVCGNVTVEQVLSIANAHLPTTPVSPVQALPPYAEQPQIHRARITAKGQVAKPIFNIGIKDIDLPADLAAGLQRDAGMGILCEMLFSESGELCSSLIERGLVSPDFSAEYAHTGDFGFLQISGEADDPDLVLAEILSYLEKQRRDGLCLQDFKRAQRVALAEFIKDFDSTEEIANTLLAFAFDGVELFSYTEALQQTDFAYVCGLFETFFDPGRFTLSIVEPQDEILKGDCDD